MPDRQLLSSQRKTDFIWLPESFFTQVLPKIQNLAEPNRDPEKRRLSNSASIVCIIFVAGIKAQNR